MPDAIHQMDLARSGIKALDMLRQRPYDLVLLDIDMPILNGVETARHIRASDEYDVLSSNRSIPIVAVTTNDSSEWRQAFAQIGMNGCISKPVVPSVLKQILYQVIQCGHSPESLA
ncbi:CheY-like superfamily [Syncephalastrum racemosum]|uniref:CheY-like superfamily n=1 Tax=Syncephalastrum racemosum TaxID=13706 RepID=A0A1X2HQJ1_SYNRA|nr:CheY-like superfamily [Syncephalastrum racemosum]